RRDRDGSVLAGSRRCRRGADLVGHRGAAVLCAALAVHAAARVAGTTSELDGRRLPDPRRARPGRGGGVLVRGGRDAALRPRVCFRTIGSRTGARPRGDAAGARAVPRPSAFAAASGALVAPGAVERGRAAASAGAGGPDGQPVRAPGGPP